MAGRGERGQSLVELAFVAPILILFILGIAELGHGLNSYMTVVSAARDGARLGATTADDDSIRNLIEKETGRLSGTIPTSCSSGSAGVCITRSGSGDDASVEVSVCYDHVMFVGIPGVLSGPLHMCSETTMRAAGGS